MCGDGRLDGQVGGGRLDGHLFVFLNPIQCIIVVVPMCTFDGACACASSVHARSDAWARFDLAVGITCRLMYGDGTVQLLFLD